MPLLFGRDGYGSAWTEFAVLAPAPVAPRRKPVELAGIRPAFRVPVIRKHRRDVPHPLFGPAEFAYCPLTPFAGESPGVGKARGARIAFFARATT